MSTKEQEYAMKIYNHLAELFNDDCENHISKDDFDDDANTTMFFHCLGTIAPGMLYARLSGEETDSITFNHMLNRLCFQFMKLDSPTQ